MKNVKEVVDGVVKILENPKLRGVIQIIFWVVFFFIVAMIFRSGKTDNVKVPNKDSNNTNTSSIVSSYEYEYDYKDGNSNIFINGTYYNNKSSFTINSKKYYEVGNTYYDALTKEVVNMDYAIDEWKYSNIKMITDNNTYTNQTKYKNGKEVYEYNIDNSIYNNYYGKNYSIDIIIIITKENNIITEATVDYGFGIATIKYKNINEIDNLDINI